MSGKISEILNNVLSMIPNEEVSNSSYLIDKSSLFELVNLIGEVSLAEESHFGYITYHDSYQHPYYYAKASFVLIYNKLYVDTVDKLVYTGVDTSDPDLRQIRINDYKHNFHIFFDYKSPSEKTVIFRITEKVGKNTELSELLHQYRVEYYRNRHKANEYYHRYKVLRTLSEIERNHYFYYTNPTLMFINDDVINLKGYPLFAISKKYNNIKGVVNEFGQFIITEKDKKLQSREYYISLKPHPLDYDELEKIQKAIRAVYLPGVVLGGVYINSSKEIWIVVTSHIKLTEDCTIYWTAEYFG